MTVSLRFAARSDRGLLREGNEDSLFAGPRLLVVADGMGGHAAGEVASAVAVGALAPLDEDVPGGDLLDALNRALDDANEQLRERVRADAQLEGMGTTVTAMLFAGNRVGVMHIGDSRAYLVRDGLTQITEDHTLVQSFVREGRISPDEANTHPQRSLLTRALDGRSSIEPDLSVREVRVGDRFLLCTDGLSGVVSDETMLREALGLPDLDEAVERLIELALRAGAPDNVSVVLAEVVDGGPTRMTPVVDGAAAEVRSDSDPSTTTAAGRAALAGRAADPPAPPADPAARRGSADHPRRSGRRVAVVGALAAALVAGTAVAAWAYVQSQYFVGVDDDHVAIFQGVEGSVAGVDLATVKQREELEVDTLPEFQAERVRKGIPADDRPHAERIVSALQRQARACVVSALPSPSAVSTAAPTVVTPGVPTASPTVSPTLPSADATCEPAP